jgi:REP element-mobilizing transposase RayT
MNRTRKSGGGGPPTYKGKHRVEHWYRDNQVYFITARCRDGYAAFASDDAKTIFWTQFDKCVAQYSYTPWVTSLIDNHYHTVGYLGRGDDLAPMMHRLHGSTAKLVNDLLEAHGQARRLPFWRESKRKNYFDGCLRDEKQGRLTYRYVCIQAQRHGVCANWRDYPHTHVNIELERAIKRALELDAFLEGVRYRRYEKGGGD